MWPVDVLPQNTSLATMMNQSGTGWYKRFLKPKKKRVRVRGWRAGIPHQAFVCSPMSTGPDWNFKSKARRKKTQCMSGGLGERWSSHCTPLSTPSPNHFYLTEPFWKHPVFSLVFMVLINVWVTGASHSREILVFCPVALLRAGWTQQHLLWPVPFAAWSESIFVC